MLKIYPENFQFILDFRCLPEADFSTLTWKDRVFLSAYLTYVTQKRSSVIVDCGSIFNILFNFTESRRVATLKQFSYLAAFERDFSEFLARRADLVKYVSDNAMKILMKDGEEVTEIYRSQLTLQEYRLLDQLTFKRDYSGFVAAVYVLGVSKSNKRCKLLNELPVKAFGKNFTHARVKCEQLFNILHFNFTEKAGIIYFGNGFNFRRLLRAQKLQKEMEMAKEAQNNEEQKENVENGVSVNEQDAIRAEAIRQLKEELREEVKAELKAEMREKLEQKKKTVEANYIDISTKYTSIKDALDFTTGEQITKDRVYYIYERLSKDNMLAAHLSDEVARAHNDPCKKILLELKLKFKTDPDFVRDELKNECKDFWNVLSGKDLGDNWREVKDRARCQQMMMQKRIIERLSVAKEKVKDQWKYNWYALSTLETHRDIFMARI